MNKNVWIALFACAGLILFGLRLTVSSEYDKIDSRATVFCEDLLASPSPKDYESLLYNKYRAQSIGVAIRTIRPHDNQHFLNVRAKILDRIGSLDRAEVRTQTEEDGLTTALVSLHGTTELSEPVYVDLIKDEADWYVVDIRFQHQ